MITVTSAVSAQLVPMAEQTVLNQSLEASFASILAALADATDAADPTEATAFDANGLHAGGEPAPWSSAKNLSNGQGRQAPLAASSPLAVPAPGVLVGTDVDGAARVGPHALAAADAVADAAPLRRLGAGSETAAVGRVEERLAPLPEAPWAEHEVDVGAGERMALLAGPSPWRVTVANAASSAGGHLEVIAGLPGTSVDFQERARQLLKDELRRAGIASYRVVVNGRATDEPLPKALS